MVFFLLREYDKVVKLRRESNASGLHTSNLENDSNNGINGENEIEDVVDGNPIKDSNRETIGMAPHAPRPNSLFSFGDINTIRDSSERGQKFLQPVNWSLSVANFILIAEYILKTETWLVLSRAKGGENNVTTHDINQHFTIPWTSGSGCSIALLLALHPGEVELMLSHSWSGSFKQTLAAIKTLVTMHFLSPETLIFFCAFSQYQAEDNISNGLTIQQQIAMEPFDSVIEARPKFGVSVIHTTLSEVYERLWCVDEVYAARKAGLEVFGLFDPSVWLLSNFAKTIAIETESAKCSNENDEKMLRRKITSGGGFAPLDAAIQKFRKKAKKDLALVLKFRASFGDLQLNLNNDMNQNESSAERFGTHS
eukprot:CAMPEP_0194161358 /NCGR_PEP_ID=MMETSP0152-20130528/78897_1 /TAXON_ID=1049557 /ORGANISM="Thalassiothrix antarctica, Strain L6-D1" /LENGTH=366 /DNA_ID=CAMNT_0038871137 /DNA_START=526 /DNA_END=1626 /DNA_ORIENTATION=+